METITVDKKAFGDLVRLIEEIEIRMESIELMNDPEFRESLEKSEEQIKKRDFADWNEL